MFGCPADPTGLRSRLRRVLWPLATRLDREKLRPVLIRYFIELPAPHGPVAEALIGSPEAWLPGLVRQASDRGERLLAEVGFGERLRASKRVEISTGTPRRLGAALYVPIAWRATGVSGLFPVLEGDLELAPLGEHRTQLAISARYTPPLDGLGAMADRGLLHRVAESTVKDFLDQVGRRLCSAGAAAGLGVTTSQEG